MTRTDGPTDQRDDPTGADAPSAHPASWTRHDAAWATVVAVLLVAPMVAGIVLTLTGDVHYQPGFDNALLELRVRDALDHVIFTGPYSRYGWYHPGPFLFYVDAIGYRLSGGSTLALPVTAYAISAAALAAVVRIVYRIGRLPAVVWVAIPTALLLRTLGSDFFHSPWNPDVALLVFLVFVVASWSLAVDRSWSAPWMLVAGSFIVQSHVGYALPVAVIAATATGVLVWRRRTQGEPMIRPGGRSRWWMFGAVGVALWALPIGGELFTDSTNLRDVATFAFSGGTSSHEARVGGLEALKVVGAQWGPKPVWALVARQDLPFGGALAYDEARWWAPVLGIGAAVGVVLAIRARRREVTALAWLIGAGFGVAIVSIASMRGLTYSYLTQWTDVLGVGLAVLVLAGVACTTPAPWWRWLGPLAVTVAIVVIGVVGVTLTRADARDRRPSDTVALSTREQQALLDAVGPPTVATLRHGRGVAVLDTTYGVLESPGLALALERADIPVRVVGKDHAVPYGPDRRWRCGRYRGRVAVFSGDENIKRHRSAWPRVAHWVVPYTAAERKHLGLVQLGWANRPPSVVRTKTLANLADRLNGPKYEVAVYVSRPGVTRCPAERPPHRAATESAG